jgi:hypothetical protein
VHDSEVLGRRVARWATRVRNGHGDAIAADRIA